VRRGAGAGAGVGGHRDAFVCAFRSPPADGEVRAAIWRGTWSARDRLSNRMLLEFTVSALFGTFYSSLLVRLLILVRLILQLANHVTEPSTYVSHVKIKSTYEVYSCNYYIS
jgi:hypothetical protein